MQTISVKITRMISEIGLCSRICTLTLLNTEFYDLLRCKLLESARREGRGSIDISKVKNDLEHRLQSFSTHCSWLSAGLGDPRFGYV